MKEAKVLNWIALVWSILGTIAMFEDPTMTIWSYVFMGVLVAAQITALKQLK